ncbi:PREDICTED: V-set and transmembrane domain-containing protein 1-like [Elephantulus edwardii]|uniref:V-set and transmembrane domain-containing protein 1-like n=1 Tax=Elephantulus edwardii TaxID=28737 RepID=UPI0003F068DB|nr:PREDICTED: V-set and transmembrane domain-containing protein 1-like [Elephantulus edwardii]
MLKEFLLCLGLCLGYQDEKKDERLPAPFFRAWPGPVAERKDSVILECSAQQPNATVRLGKLNSSGYEEQLSSAKNSAKLFLRDLEPEDAGRYFCAYNSTSSQGWSETQYLQLVVTGKKGSSLAHWFLSL